MKKISKSSVILAVETCTNICSVALWDGAKLHTRVTEVARSHSKELLPMVESTLLAANLSMKDVEYIACARGPGSFTGVRIGIGVAKGLAYGQDIPIIPISPLLVLAVGMQESNREENKILAMLDARMGEVYAASYNIVNGCPILQGQEILTTAETLNVDNLLVGGTGALEYKDILSSNGAKFSLINYPLAETMISIAQNFDIKPVTATDFVPVYLRDKVTY